jgi:transposase
MTKHTKQFKGEPIRLALTSPQTIAKAARDLAIKPSTLYAWVSAAKDQAPVFSYNAGNQINFIDELNRLRKENTRLEEEREILKKATGSSNAKCNTL